MEDIKMEIAELKELIKVINERLDKLKQENSEVGIYLDGCNDVVRNYIQNDIKKDGDN